MSHAVLKIGYRRYVLPIDVAVIVAQALIDGEQYDSAYVRPEDRGDSDVSYTYHVWKEVSGENTTIEFITDDRTQPARSLRTTTPQQTPVSSRRT